MEYGLRICTAMNSSNLNATSRVFTLTTAGVTVQLSFFSITFVLGVVGNILLVTTVYKRPALHKVTYYLVSALAIEDLLTLITYAIFIPQALVLGDWFLGDFACLINSFLMVLCGFCELCLLAVISLDRYIACCRPLRYADVVTPRRCALSIAFCWIFAMALASFLIIDCQFYGYDKYLKNCQLESAYTTKTRNCLAVTFCMSILPCTTTIAVCQWKILKQVKRVTQNTPPNVISDTNENTFGNRPSKATLTVSLMTGTFFVCWFPFMVVNSWGSVINWKQSNSLYEVQYLLKRIMLQIFFVSKFSNPIIYGIYNSEFRTECRKLLKF